MGYCGWCPYINKWWTFTASIFVALCCGLTYTFAIWSSELKRIYGLQQDQLELIATAANIGGYSAIFSGLTYDALERHKRFGPRITLLLGCTFNAVGYLGLWAAVSGLFHASYWQLVAMAAVAANGGTWGDTAVLATGVRNFPSSRGSMVGVLKASIGLSGSLFACVYSGIFAPDVARYLLFLALAPLAVCLLALPFINHCSFVQQSETESGQHVFTAEGRFLFALQALGVLAVYLITSATVEALHPLSPSTSRVLTMVAALLLLPLLLLPYGSGGLLSKKASLRRELSLYQDEDNCGAGEGAGEHGPRGCCGSAMPGGGSRGGEQAEGKASLVQPLLDPPDMERDGGGAASSASAEASQDAAHTAGGPAAAPGGAAAAPGVLRQFPELSPTECLRCANFWLLFGVLTVGMGAGLTLLNNLAQVARALSGPPEHIPVLVSLFSVCNCAGRMALGYIPERMLHSLGTPRLLFLPLVSALMAATCLALAFAPLRMLFPLAALAGFAFGGHWTLFPSFVSELFGLARFAANYSLMQLAPALGSFALAMSLAGALYERALRKHGAEGSNTCVGQDCFQLTFLVLGSLGAAATVASTVLYRRNRELYRLEYQEVHSYDEEVSRQNRDNQP